MPTSVLERPKIHPTAIVDPACELAPGVEIGPYCVLTGKVRLAPGVRLVAAVHMMGPVEVGENTIVYPNACLGFPPQDYKFKLGDATAGAVIGRDCIIREGATVHAASKPDKPTIVGDRVFMMAYAHVGHDALVMNNVILVNNVMLAGHCVVEENATMSGGSAVHQFGAIGRFAFVSGAVAMAVNTPPFCVSGERNTVSGINRVGLRRNGFSRHEINQIVEAFRHAFMRPLPRQEMLSVLRELGKNSPHVSHMADFVAKSRRPIAMYRGGMLQDSAE
jgi:UDP-N-acetylglucosamine acyltransferase